jgi:aminoglycoside phosphotransferase (APT) family kinase protein
MLAWEDDDVPLLVLEDLSAAHWPPPWTRAQVEAVRRTLDTIHARRLPQLPAATIGGMFEQLTWRDVATNPGDFLKLGLCTEAWLARAAPALIEAEQQGEAACTGDEFCHQDLQSDNICLAGDRVFVIDWNFAAHGNGELDIASWLPSLQAEGGPSPEEILPNAPHWAAAISGYFAPRAGLAVIPEAPRVRAVQFAQLKTALPWAQRALGLPPLDGPNA